MRKMSPSTRASPRRPIFTNTPLRLRRSRTTRPSSSKHELGVARRQVAVGVEERALAAADQVLAVCSGCMPPSVPSGRIRVRWPRELDLGGAGAMNMVRGTAPWPPPARPLYALAAGAAEREGRAAGLAALRADDGSRPEGGPFSTGAGATTPGVGCSAIGLCAAAEVGRLALAPLWPHHRPHPGVSRGRGSHQHARGRDVWPLLHAQHRRPGLGQPGRRRLGVKPTDDLGRPALYRCAALMASSVAAPGQSSASPKRFSGVSTVPSWSCRSFASGST